jgi:hypothetical protein
VNSITIGSLLILMMDKSYDRSSSSEAPNL